MIEERQQRDALESQEKQEVEKIITDLNTQLTKLKEDCRKLRKTLSTTEVEASTWKQRHDEFEHTLREALGNLNGTRASLFKVQIHIPTFSVSPTYRLCRTLGSSSEISSLLRKNSMSSRQTLQRRTDSCATAIRSWKTLAWKAVAWPSFLSASAKRVDKM